MNPWGKVWDRGANSSQLRANVVGHSPPAQLSSVSRDRSSYSWAQILILLSHLSVLVKFSSLDMSVWQMKNIVLLFPIKIPIYWNYLFISKLVFDRECSVFMRISCRSDLGGGLRARKGYFGDTIPLVTCPPWELPSGLHCTSTNYFWIQHSIIHT